MNCYRCGAPSEVLDTRVTKHGALRRRRQCFNEHRFVTVEVPASAVRTDRLSAMAARAVEAVARWKRNLAIRRDARSSRKVAAEHGISHKTVLRVRS